jgi:hypothetical protein
MAKGNTGNFLQHFVGLTAAARLRSVAGAFEYVDPFAMGPWERLERPDAEFVRMFGSLDARPDDAVARAFVEALRVRYPYGRPANVKAVEYPNTTMLLLHAGMTPSRVTFCERDDAKRKALAAELTRAGVTHESHPDSRTARLQGCERAAFVMLDPYQVQAPRRKDGAGYITVDEVRGLLGSSNVDVLGRARNPTAPPCVVSLFSFSEQCTQADATDRAVRAELERKAGWHIHLVRESMEITTGNRRKGWHQGWWCASHASVEPYSDLQHAWDEWRAR